MESEPVTAKPSLFVSRAPPHAASLFVDKTDAKMAERQTHYETMTPDQRATQDVWAQSFLQRYTPCPVGYDWQRIKGKGYQCKGGSHLVTDELIHEGKGGLMILRYRNPWFPAIGPYYEIPGRLGWWKYAGHEPNWPDTADEMSLGYEHIRERERLPRELTGEQREYLLRRNRIHNTEAATRLTATHTVGPTQEQQKKIKTTTILIIKNHIN
jgi:hypothetical protein